MNCYQTIDANTRATTYRCRHKLASMPRHALHTTRPRVCVGRLPCPEPLHRWLSSKKVETVHFSVLKQCPIFQSSNFSIALLATPLHNPFAGPCAPRRCARSASRASRALARPLMVCTRVLCAEDPAMLCAQLRHTLAPIAPLAPSPRTHSQFARIPGHLGRRLREGLRHRGHRGHDQARAQPAAVRHARARRQHQPRLRRVRSLGRRRLGLLDRVARAGGQRIFTGETSAKHARAHARPTVPFRPCARATCS